MVNKMIKNKWFWITLVGVLILAAGGGYYYTTKLKAAEATAADEPAMQTAVARIGDLSVLGSGTGTLTPAAEINLGFDENGTLLELNAQVGQYVEAGYVLARLQTKDSAEDIAAAIADAELAVVKAQNALDELYENSDINRTAALSDIAVYAQEARDAQYQMDYYILPSYLEGMDTIEAYDQTKAELDAAVLAFEPYKYLSENNDTRQTLLDTLGEAQRRYDAAVKRLDYEYALQVAQANLKKARQEYEKYKDGPAPDQLAEAQAELANSQAALALAQQDQPVIELTAPFAGTIMSVDAVVGESLSATTFITLADLAHPMLEVYLDESDLDKVAVGYTAEVVFDALPDQTFSGHVVTVSPGLETVSNVTAVKAMVALDTSSLDASISLPVGLNASVDIIAGQALNAVLVPVEALRELDPGEYAVFVIEDSEPELRVVQVGLMDITYAEIVSGLEAGEVVSTGIVQTK